MKNILKKIKLVILDVDGVLTDGSIIIGSDKTEYKKFNVKDGMGISLAKFYGLKIAIITGRNSEVVNIRSNELNIEYVFQGISDKESLLSELLEQLEIKKENVCFIGDDINDIPIMKKVGYSVAPSDATDIVKSYVDAVTIHRGGQGSVREVIDIILSAQTDYKMLVNDFLKSKIKIKQ